MNISNAERALVALRESDASPQIKDEAGKILVRLVDQEAVEDKADRRAHRYLKFGLAWFLVGAWVTAMGHAWGLWTIQNPEQLPWVWGSAMAFTLSGTQYLLRVLFKKA